MSGAPPGGPALVELLDVSRYQDLRGPIDWQRVAASGIAGVYVKATEGTTYVNQSLVADVGGARAAGLEVGAYLFLRGLGGAGQGQHFLATIAGLDLTLPPALDVEVGHSEIADIACNCLDVVEPVAGEAVVYTYEAFQGALQRRPALGSRRLWLAAYHAREPVPAGPWKGQAWWAWQHTGNGTCPGVVGPVDRSRARGLPVAFDAAATLETGPAVDVVEEQGCALGPAGVSPGAHRSPAGR